MIAAAREGNKRDIWCAVIGGAMSSHVAGTSSSRNVRAIGTKISFPLGGQARCTESLGDTGS
jgi:hypothetical protein